MKDLARKILVVDDNDDIREMLSLLLGMRGYRVVVAADGEEAIQVAASERPDVILMDVMMPRLNGLEAARRIRRNPQLSAVPIIGLSAFSDPLAGEAGSDPFRWSAYLRKPIDMEELERVLGTALSPN
jgi:CheY-like chemotaxis protein